MTASADADHRPVEVGDRAPAFAAVDQEGREVRLDDLLGRGPVVLFFYPKDESPGCTAEACAFRDAFEEFRGLDAEVLGLSGDDADRHRRFAERHDLPFRLLHDEDDRIRRRFGVPRTLGLMPGRTTYVLDRDGIVRHRFNAQLRPKRHVRESIEAVRRLESPEA